MAERGFRGLPNMPNTQNGADHRLPDSGFRAGVAGVQALDALIDRVSPATVAIAMLAGFGFAVGVGSLFVR